MDCVLVSSNISLDTQGEGADCDGYIVAFVISPQNHTGRADNVTWDEEYTLVVSDW